MSTAEPAPNRSSRSVVVLCGLLATATWLFVWAANVFTLIFIVPKFEEIFRDFGVAIPWVARAFISVARDCQSMGLGWLAYAGWLVLIIGAGVLAWTRRSPRAGLLLFFGALLTGLVQALAFVVSMQVPLNEMIRSLQSGA